LKELGEPMKRCLARPQSQAKEPPVLVPIGAALDALHDGDMAALAAPLSHRRYDAATLNRLWDQLARRGVRIRGQVDHGRPRWIEAAELLDYRLKYRSHLNFAGGIIAAVSHLAYPAREITDRSEPRQWPGAVEPSYAVVVRNLRVETTGRLLTEVDAVSRRSDPEPTPRAEQEPELVLRNKSRSLRQCAFLADLEKLYPAGTWEDSGIGTKRPVV
jgi:hypothetical protein